MDNEIFFGINEAVLKPYLSTCLILCCWARRYLLVLEKIDQLQSPIIFGNLYCSRQIRFFGGLGEFRKLKNKQQASVTLQAFPGALESFLGDISPGTISPKRALVLKLEHDFRNFGTIRSTTKRYNYVCLWDFTIGRTRLHIAFSESKQVSMTGQLLKEMQLMWLKIWPNFLTNTDEKNFFWMITLSLKLNIFTGFFQLCEHTRLPNIWQY